MNQTYHVGNKMKPGSKIAYTVQPDGKGYHIAECRYRSNAVKIVEALNQCTAGGPPAKPQEK